MDDRILRRSTHLGESKIPVPKHPKKSTAKGVSSIPSPEAPIEKAPTTEFADVDESGSSPAQTTTRKQKCDDTPVDAAIGKKQNLLRPMLTQ